MRMNLHYRKLNLFKNDLTYKKTIDQDSPFHETI